MSTIEQLRLLFQPVLNECGVLLYDLRWTGNGKERTLEVSIMQEDGSMDLDTCAAVSEKLSEILDASDVSEAAYTLEVCSPGAEREIRSLSELDGVPEPYVYIRLKHPVNKLLELTGEVIEHNEEEMTISYREKTRKVTAVFPVEDIDFIRFAVRF